MLALLAAIVALVILLKDGLEPINWWAVYALLLALELAWFRVPVIINSRHA